MTLICCQVYIFLGKAGFCYYCAVLCCVQVIEYIMARWLYLFVCTLHYLIISNMQVYLTVLNSEKTCQVHSVVCVSKIKSVLSIIFNIIYGAVCIQLTHSLMMIVRICVLYFIITIKSEI